MPAFLCKFHGELAPNKVHAPKTAADWEGGMVNVPRPRQREGDSTTTMAAGNTIYLWVHDAQERSYGCGLTAKAVIAEVKPGRDDEETRLHQGAAERESLDVTIRDVELLPKPVSWHEFKAEKQARSRVGDTLTKPDRVTIYIEDTDIEEWENHYNSFDTRRKMRI
jgi:hypothetical protein